MKNKLISKHIGLEPILWDPIITISAFVNGENGLGPPLECKIHKSEFETVGKKFIDLCFPALVISEKVRVLYKIKLARKFILALSDGNSLLFSFDGEPLDIHSTAKDYLYLEADIISTRNGYIEFKYCAGIIPETDNKPRVALYAHRAIFGVGDYKDDDIHHKTFCRRDNRDESLEQPRNHKAIKHGPNVELVDLLKSLYGIDVTELF